MDAPESPAPFGLRATLRAAARWWRPHAGLAAALVGLVMLQQSFATVLAVGLKFIVDDVQSGARRLDFAEIGVALAAGFALAALAGLAGDYLESLATGRILRRLRVELYAQVQRLGIAFMSQARTGDILSRFSSDLDALRQGVTSRLLDGVRAGVGLLISLPVLWALDAPLAAMSCAVVPGVLLTVRALGRPAARATQALRQHEADVLGSVQESVRALPVIQAFSLSETFNARFGRQVEALERTGLRAGFRIALTGTSAALTVQLVTLLLTLGGAWRVYHGDMTAGTLVAFTALHAVVGAHAIELGRRVLPALLRASGSVQRVQALLDLSPKVSQPIEAGAPAPTLDDVLTLDRVSFAYAADRPVLHDVSLTLRQGEHVALVGPSGCGKSSVLQLLLRFYDPDAGAVRVDGVDLRTVDADAWRRRVGVVLQDTVLIYDSLRENVRLARPDATDAEVAAACEQAAIDRFVRDLPEGYDTQTGEAGAWLSGGQRQRVAIARAVLRRPRLLLLDEATSALDPATEHEVAQSLEALARGCTVVNVTHRLSNAKTADRIIVMDAGRIVEEGTHDALVARGGRYAALWAKQNGFALSEDGRRASIDADRLRAMPLFAELSDLAARRLAAEFETQSFARGETVFRRGDVGDRFYVLVRGQMDVRLDSGGRVVLADGDFFGEIALLEARPRTATVSARTDCVAISIDRGAFARLLAREPSLRETLEEAALERRFRHVPATMSGVG